MQTNDATAIGIPRIVDPILGTDELSKSNEVIASLTDENALLVSLDSFGQRFLIDSEIFIIGREKTVDAFLDDHSVSRKHAEIVRRNGEWFIEDLGSLNGTYLNGKLIDCQDKINSGDEVQIGRYHLGFYAK